MQPCIYPEELSLVLLCTSAVLETGMKLPFRGALKVSGDGIPASNNGRKVSQILAYEEDERSCSTAFF